MAVAVLAAGSGRNLNFYIHVSSVPFDYNKNDEIKYVLVCMCWCQLLFRKKEYRERTCVVHTFIIQYPPSQSTNPGPGQNSAFTFYISGSATSTCKLLIYDTVFKKYSFVFVYVIMIYTVVKKYGGV